MVTILSQTVTHNKKERTNFDMLVVCGFQQQQFEALSLACQCLSKWVGAGLEWHGKSGPRKTNMVKDLFGVVNKAKELGANDSNV